MINSGSYPGSARVTTETRQTMDKKHKQLGMPYGTASARLKKRIMFDLAAKLGLLTCYRCDNKIESIEEFTIDHKIPWLDNDPSVFWDINNIAFSHAKCNYLASRPNRIEVIHGKSKCSSCGKTMNVRKFAKNKSRWNGIDFECKKCKSDRVLSSDWYKDNRK